MYSPVNATSNPPAGCKAVQVNLVARHGARYPGKSDINKFAALSDKMSQYNYNPAYAWMKTWKSPYSVYIVLLFLFFFVFSFF